MLTITTTADLPTEKERKEHVIKFTHLMDFKSDVLLECSSGKFKYNFLKDLFEIGTKKDFRIGLSTREVYRNSEDEFEINDFTDGWSTAYVNAETLEDLAKGKKSLIDLTWK